jgi:hypothetical protein
MTSLNMKSMVVMLAQPHGAIAPNHQQMVVAIHQYQKISLRKRYYANSRPLSRLHHLALHERDDVARFPGDELLFGFSVESEPQSFPGQNLPSIGRRSLTKRHSRASHVVNA